MVVLHDDLICRDENRIKYRLGQYRRNKILPSNERKKIIEILEKSIESYEKIIDTKKEHQEKIFFILNQCNPEEIITGKNGLKIYGGDKSRAFIQIENIIFTGPEVEHEALLYYLMRHNKIFQNYTIKKKYKTEYFKINSYKSIPITRYVGELYKQGVKINIKNLSIGKFQIDTKKKTISFVQNGSGLLYQSKINIEATIKILKENFPEYKIDNEGKSLISKEKNVNII